MQPLQKRASPEHESDEDHVRRRALAQHDLHPAFRRDVLQRRDDERDIAERVDDENEQDRRGEEFGIHRPIIRAGGQPRSNSACAVTTAMG